MYTNLVAKNTFYQLISRTLSASFSVVLSISLVRELGVDNFGVFSLALAYITIFIAISEFGTNSTAIRLFSDPKYFYENFGSFITFRFLISAISAIALISLLPFLGYSSEIVKLSIIGIALIIFNSFIKAFGLAFQARKDFIEQSKANVISYGISYFLLFFSIGTNLISPIVALWIMVMNSAVTVSYLFYIYRKEFRITTSIDKGYMKFLLSDSWVIGFTMVINMLMVNIDRVMMGWLSTSEQIGIYSIAYKIFDLALVFPTFIMNIYYPILLDLKSDLSKYSKLFVSILIRFFVMGIFTTGALYYLSPVIKEFWGMDAIESVKALQLLSLGTVLFFMTSPLSWRLVGESMKKPLVLTYTLGLLVNVFINYLYLNEYGYIAAIFSTIISEFIVLVLLVYFNLRIRQSMTKR